MTVKKLVSILTTAHPDAQVRVRQDGWGYATVTKAQVTKDKIVGSKAKSADGTQVTIYVL